MQESGAVRNPVDPSSVVSQGGSEMGGLVLGRGRCRYGGSAECADRREDARRHPFTGLGKPEALKGDLRGWWSRRITGAHRLVYCASGQVNDRRLEIVACRTTTASSALDTILTRH